MNNELMKNKFNNLLKQTNGVKIYALCLTENKEYMIKEINAIDELRDSIANKIKYNLTNFVNDEVEFTEYDEYNEGPNSYCVIEKNKINNLITNQDYDKVNDFIKKENERIIGFIYRYGNNDEITITIYEELYPISILKKEGILLLPISNSDKPQFGVVNEDIIRLSASTNVVIMDEYIICNKISILEKRFGFYDFISRQSADTEKTIIESGVFVENYKFIEFATDEKIKKKLAKYNNSPVLKLDQNTLISRLKTIDYYNKNVKIINGKIVLDTKKDMNIFIKILGDDILTSKLTENNYDAINKKKTK